MTFTPRKYLELEADLSKHFKACLDRTASLCLVPSTQTLRDDCYRYRSTIAASLAPSIIRKNRHSTFNFLLQEHRGHAHAERDHKKHCSLEMKGSYTSGATFMRSISIRLEDQTASRCTLDIFPRASVTDQVFDPSAECILIL